MGLAQMLSVSSSLRAAADQPHRFRTARRGGLPKFDVPVRLYREAPMKTERNADAVSKGGADGIAALEAQIGARIGGHAPPRGWSDRLVSVLRKWFAPGKGQGMGRGSAAPSGGSANQARQQELRLENVRVCRNDLMDADWDLAPPKSGARLAFLRQLAGTGQAAAQRRRTVAREADAARS